MIIFLWFIRNVVSGKREKGKGASMEEEWGC